MAGRVPVPAEVSNHVAPLPIIAGCRSTGADVVINTRDDSTFDPPSPGITRGQTVCWQNSGRLTYSVTATGSLPFDATWTDSTFNEHLQPGGVVIRSFGVAGTYSYQCTIHSGMTGSIDVR